MTQLKKILAQLESEDLQSLFDDVEEYDRIRAEEGDDAGDVLDNENTTNVAFTEPKILKNVELVRLTKKPLALDKMLCHDSTSNLGLTVGPFGDKIPDDPDGFCFAFQKSYYEKRKATLQSKYGKHELVFKVKEALEVEHLGDGERQVIFSPQAIISKKPPRST